MDASNTLFAAVGALFFIAVFLGVEGLYLWWNARHGPAARSLSRRLQMMSAGDVSGEAASLLKQRMLGQGALTERMLSRIPRVRSLDRLIVQSGVEWTVATFIGLTVGLFLCGALVSQLLRAPVLVEIAAAVVLALIPFNYLLYRRAQRLARFDELLPDALDMIGRAMRAGHSFPSALRMAGTELPSPIGDELRQTFDEINFGIPASEALLNLSNRVPSVDLKFFVIAVLIQKDTGGNLTEVLDNLGSIIRERIKLFGQVKVLTAEARISGWVLALLPFVLTAFLMLINPTYMSKLWTHPTGRTMLTVGLVMMVLGILWMRRIIRIRF